MKNRKLNASTARWVRRAALSSTALSALALGAVLSGPALAANTYEWQGTTATSDWSLSTNWSQIPGPVTAPPPAAADTAIFSDDGNTLVTFSAATTTINTIKFGNETIVGTVTPEQAFTFNIGAGANNTVVVGNDNAGEGVVNTGTAHQIFNIGNFGAFTSELDFSKNTTAGDASVTYNVNGAAGGFTAGVMTFNDGSNAGGINISDGTSNGAIINVGGGTGGGNAGGQVSFNGTSTAALATITVTGGNTTGGGGNVFFFNSSNGGGAHMTALAGTDASGSTSGHITFENTSSAGHSTGFAQGSGGVGFLPGQFIFINLSTADSSALTAGGGSAGGFGGLITFFNSSTAGNSTLIANASADAVATPDGGHIDFSNGSTAGSANITANASTVLNRAGGNIGFHETSTAAFSTINVLSDPAGIGQGGRLLFLDNSSAGSALISIHGTFGSAAASQGQATFGGAGLATASNALIFNDGILTFATGGAGGDASIGNTNQVVFTGTGDGGTADYFGVVGNATLDIRGVVNPATQTFPGTGVIPNIVNLNTIGGEGSVLLGNNNLVVGSENGSATFFGHFVGTGTTSATMDNVVKVGLGSWVLNGVTPAGNINVFEINNGTVQVGDHFNPGAVLGANGLVIDPLGTLSGHGTVIAPIINNGTLAPGGSIGTLTVTGSVTTGETATTSFEVNPVANSLLAVKGGVGGTFLADGTLNFSFDTGKYFGPRLITVVTATGGVSSDDGGIGFDTVTTSNLPPGGNPLKIITINTGGGSQSIAVVFAPGSGLGGTGLPSISTGLLDQSQDITSLIFRHLQDGRGGTAGSASAALMPQLAYAGLADGGAGAPTQVAQGPMGGWASGPRVWVRPFGRSAQTDSQGFNVGFRDEGGGVVAGIDQRFDGGFLLGVAGAYSHDDFTTSASLTNGSTNSWRVSGYGSWEMGPFAIDAQGGYTHDSIKTTRNLGLAGAPNESHGGDEGHAAVEASYRAQFGRANVIPWAGFNYVHLSEGAFTETGGLPGFNLTVNSHTTDSAQFQAGVRVNSTFQMDGGWSLTPEARLGVSQELASTNRSVIAGFPGVPLAGTFLLTGVSPDRTAGLAGVGLVAKANQSLDLFVDADGRFSGNQKAGIISAGLRWTFGASSPPPPPAAPPPPAPQAQPMTPPPSQAQVFVVYFDFDKSVLTPQATSIIRQAADAYKRTGAVTIKIDGYTDLAGTAQYNLGLSKRRADAVRAELAKDGVAATAIAEAWHGKDNPAVPTPDGVREPRNRRVTLALP